MIGEEEEENEEEGVLCLPQQADEVSAGYDSVI
jgi:hypothetical protein